MGLTMKDKKALTQELARRYRGSDRKQKTTILDEFVSTTGYRRKYAIHLLANWGKWPALSIVDTHGLCGSPF